MSEPRTPSNMIFVVFFVILMLGSLVDFGKGLLVPGILASGLGASRIQVSLLKRTIGICFLEFGIFQAWSIPCVGDSKQDSMESMDSMDGSKVGEGMVGGKWPKVATLLELQANTALAWLGTATSPG